MSLHTIHLSGLSADCDETEVESDLRRITAKVCVRPKATDTLSFGACVSNASAELLVSLVGAPIEAMSPTAEDHNVCNAHLEPVGAEKVTTAADLSEVSEKNLTAEVDRFIDATEPTSGDAVVDIAHVDVESKADATVAVATSEVGGSFEAKGPLEADQIVREQAPLRSDKPTEEPSETSALISVAVVRDKKTGCCKGFCFVDFVSVVDAEAAVALLNVEGVRVAGCPVQAQLSKPKGDRRLVAPDPEDNLEDIPKQHYKKNTSFNSKHRATWTSIEKLPGGLKAEAKRRNATRKGKP